jgi:hypothetical protein
MSGTAEPDDESPHRTPRAGVQGLQLAEVMDIMTFVLWAMAGAFAAAAILYRGFQGDDTVIMNALQTTAVGLGGLAVLIRRIVERYA